MGTFCVVASLFDFVPAEEGIRRRIRIAEHELQKIYKTKICDWFPIWSGVLRFARIEFAWPEEERMNLRIDDVMFDAR